MAQMLARLETGAVGPKLLSSVFLWDRWVLLLPVLALAEARFTTITAAFVAQ